MCVVGYKFQCVNVMVYGMDRTPYYYVMYDVVIWLEQGMYM